MDARRPSPPTPQIRGLTQRKLGPARARLNVYVPPALARRVRVRAAALGREISELVTDALAAHLDQPDEPSADEAA